MSNIATSLYLPSTASGDDFKKVVRDAAMQHDWDFLVTLNHHRNCSRQRSKAKLRLWNMNMRSRMFRRELEVHADLSDSFYFYAFKEFDSKGHPHWHLLVKAAPEVHARLERVVWTRWRNIAKGGTAHVRPFGETPDDLLRAASYVSKSFNSQICCEDFTISTDFPCATKTVARRSASTHRAEKASSLSPMNFAALQHLKGKLHESGTYLG